MAGDRDTSWKGELFDLLSQEAPLTLTAITRGSWGIKRSQVDVLFFAIADGATVADAAELAGVSGQQAWAWLKKAGENELLRKARHSD